MVLSGGLSNPDFKDLVQSLTRCKRRKAPAKRRKRFVGWPDGRRQFGTVSSAILKVLSLARGEMTVQTIHAEVERLLDGDVSRHSVADHLIKRSTGKHPLFERTRYGHYRLLR
jgi:hypothetical protein